MLFLATLGSLICLFPSTAIAQTKPCPCTDGNHLSAWGIDLTKTPCVGGCEGVRERTRQCIMFTSNDGSEYEINQCIVKETCLNKEICVGKWTEWGNTGICDANCRRVQTRICHVKDKKGLNFRTIHCIGANGKDEQHRIASCNSVNCTKPNETTTESTATTASMTRSGGRQGVDKPLLIFPASPVFRTTPSMRPQTRPVISPTSKENGIDGDVKGGNDDKGENDESDNDDKNDGNDGGGTPQRSEPTKSSDKESDTVILAAVLGSVALVCVTAAFVSIAVLVHRKKYRRTPHPCYSGASTVMSPVTRNVVNYEVVDLAPLPNRHQVEIRPYQQTVPNTLYQPMEEKDKMLPSSGTTANPDGYLSPAIQDSVSPMEAAYFTIADNRA